MKWIHIVANQRGLLFRRGAYQRVLAEGAHWFWGNSTVHIVDIAQPFAAPAPWSTLLADAELAAAIEVFDVADGQLGLLFEAGLLKAVRLPGRYAFWRGGSEYRFVVVDTTGTEIDSAIPRVLLQHALLAPHVRREEVQSWEQAVLFVDGAFSGVLAPGVYHWWRNGIPIHVGRTDRRQQQLEINGQEILTRDKAALRINAWAQYLVENIEVALLQNKDWDKQLYVALQLALREYVAGFSFEELLEKKESIGAAVLLSVSIKAAALGVQVTGFGIRDIVLPGDVKEIMNRVLVAEKQAQANGITRREETASTRSLLNTAKLMEDNPNLWKLKEMEYIERIAEKVSDISLSGGSAIIEQMKGLFMPAK